MELKPIKMLSRRGRLRRYRTHAQASLQAYGLAGAPLTLVSYNDNVIYRVDVDEQHAPSEPCSPYLPARLVLRSHATSELEAVACELIWLKALREGTGLSIPTGLPTLDGDLAIRVITPGLPKGRVVTLLRWLDGRSMAKGLTARHFNSWGAVTARMHEFASHWVPPAGFVRPVWDWSAQLGGSDFDESMDELIASMPDDIAEKFQIISDNAKEVMGSLGQGPDAFGMIHSDMYNENVLFKSLEARPFDFEDCGFGYWLWDIAVALNEGAWTDGWRSNRDAFLEGYHTVRSLPERQLGYLNLFIAVIYATMVLWSSAFIKHDPMRSAEYEVWRNGECRKLLRYFELFG
jgi:Ser/Thr protein kinase RdoA (MazF antagonist)